MAADEQKIGEDLVDWDGFFVGNGDHWPALRKALVEI